MPVHKHIRGCYQIAVESNSNQIPSQIVFLPPTVHTVLCPNVQLQTGPYYWPIRQVIGVRLAPGDVISLHQKAELVGINTPP